MEGTSKARPAVGNSSLCEGGSSEIRTYCVMSVVYKNEVTLSGALAKSAFSSASPFYDDVYMLEFHYRTAKVCGCIVAFGLSPVSHRVSGHFRVVDG